MKSANKPDTLSFSEVLLVPVVRLGLAPLVLDASRHR
jgi:hypothetical protein